MSTIYKVVEEHQTSYVKVNEKPKGLKFPKCVIFTISKSGNIDYNDYPCWVSPNNDFKVSTLATWNSISDQYLAQHAARVKAKSFLK